jgi:hypothetical protein
MTATARCAWRPSLTRGACWHRRCARRQVRHLDRPRYSSRCTATPPRTCCRTGASGRAPSYPRVCCAAPLCCLRCLSPPECAGHCFPKMACRQGELLRSSSAAHDHDVLAHAVKLRVLVVPACGCAADLLGDALRDSCRFWRLCSSWTCTARPTRGAWCRAQRRPQRPAAMPSAQLEHQAWQLPVRLSSCDFNALACYRPRALRLRRQALLDRQAFSSATSTSYADPLQPSSSPPGAALPASAACIRCAFC